MSELVTSGGVVCILAALLVASLTVGLIPGAVASTRRHSKTEAIAVCGILGVLFTLGLLWCVALVWAYTEDHRGEYRRPARRRSSADTDAQADALADLRDRH